MSEPRLADHTPGAVEGVRFNAALYEDFTRRRSISARRAGAVGRSGGGAVPRGGAGSCTALHEDLVGRRDLACEAGRSGGRSVAGEHGLGQGGTPYQAACIAAVWGDVVRAPGPVEPAAGRGSGAASPGAPDEADSSILTAPGDLHV